jgi:hypothetical protein
MESRENSCNATAGSKSLSPQGKRVLEAERNDLEEILVVKAMPAICLVPTHQKR